MRKYFAAVFILLLAACGTPSQETSVASNGSSRVDKLFSHDGCTVYRFYDGGEYQYFANCGGDR